MRLIWAFLLAIGAAHGATYTVATNGNDANAGTAAAPFRTLGKAAGRAVAGDTVQLRGGTYNEAVTLWQSGTASAPIRIQAYPGESPVMDGQGKLPTAQWYGLLHLGGAYLEASGIEIKNSAQRGLVLYGGHDAAHKMVVHDVQSNGILIEGDDCLVEDSEVYRAALSNENGKASGWAGGLNAARGADGITSRAVIRRNRVHDNWGEGLSSFEADGTVIEDNTVYNNFSVNLYLSDLRNALVQRNLVYNTAGAPLRNGNPASGITIADENASKPRSSGNRVINNLLRDVPFCAMCWSLVSGSTLDNTLIAHNTLVNGSIQVGPVSGATRVVNNLANAAVVGGSTINAESFRLKAASPATPVLDVPLDYFKVARSTPTTLGAIEFGVVTPPTPPPPDPVVYPTFSINIYQKGAQVQQLPASGDEIRIVPK